MQVDFLREREREREKERESSLSSLLKYTCSILFKESSNLQVVDTALIRARVVCEVDLV